MPNAGSTIGLVTGMFTDDQSVPLNEYWAA